MKKIILILGFIILGILAGCNSVRVYEGSPIYALGTVVNIELYNVKDSKVHYNEIKKIYNDVNRIASDYESNYLGSAIYDLNVKRSIKADSLLIDLLNEAMKYKDISEGFYNPFIGRLSHIWKDAIKKGEMPDPLVISSELAIMNGTSLIIEEENVSIIGDGNIDLGGIAKGYATQKALEYLRVNNIDGYLINAGSSNVLLGTKLGNGFRVGLNNPINNKYYGYINSKNIAIGTSSIENQMNKLDGKLIHHIINPFTGYPENKYQAVTLIGQDSLLLDAMSTVMFMCDIEQIKKFEKRLDVMAIVYNNGIIYKNEGCDFLEKV